MPWSRPEKHRGMDTTPIVGYLTDKQYDECEDAARFALKVGIIESFDKSAFVLFCLKFTTQRLFEVKKELDEKGTLPELIP